MFHLKTKSKATGISGFRDPSKRCRLLCYGHGFWKVQVDGFIKTLDKVNSLQIVISSEGIGHPFSIVSRIVEVQHRSHCINPDAVDMKVLKPVQRITD